MTGIDFTTNTVRYRQLWGNDNSSLSQIDIKGIDVLEFRESYHQLPGLRPFKNGVIDLSAGLKEVHDKFEKGFKYEVRRAEKDGFVCRHIDLSEFVLKAYYDFSDRKKITSLGTTLLKLFCEKNVLLVSAAYANEVVLQYHLYFVMDREIILLASFPATEVPKVKKTAIGFANRYLHWFDIQHAASIGKQFYNLGGMGNDPDATDTAGISKFKMEMSPEVRDYYHGIIPVSLKGKMYITLKKFFSKNV